MKKFTDGGTFSSKMQFLFKKYEIMGITEKQFLLGKGNRNSLMSSIKNMGCFTQIKPLKEGQIQ